MNIRERLARAACFRGMKCEASGPDGCETAERCFLWDDEPLKIVDAILAEMKVPSAGMLSAAVDTDPLRESDPPYSEIWQAMNQHIRDGGS